ncbi:MAG TPA: response regulator transcription factor [Dehalococcoidia bacterium]
MTEARGGASLLLVDDDARLTTALRRALTLHGYDVEVAGDAGRALAYLDHDVPELIVLDVMMPGVDGLRLCKIIRDRHDVPILMLTAMDSVPDRVAGLEAGADDYLVKPFATDELLARLAALLRRARPRAEAQRRLAYADLVLDSGVWQVARAGTALSLTAKEFRILEALLRSPEQVLSREEILSAAWGEEESAESNVVDVHVASLRQKLEQGGGRRIIQTIRGVGYILKDGE